jgi:NAD(P)H-dependent FMN reductase
MIPADLGREPGDGQRAANGEPYQDGKQGAIETDPGFAKQGVVPLGAGEEAHEINQSGAERINIAGVTHLYTTVSQLHKACMIHSYPTLVIAGSVRPRRVALRIAQWVAEVGHATTDGTFEVVDLKDWPLPMDDEPGVPAGGAYEFEHTRAWSRKIAGAEAFVFVTPQYNWGYPAPLKNALDHLYGEWAGKPAMIVTYGGHGGDRCAEQLRQVCEGLHMAPVATRCGFRLSRERIEANSGEIDPALEFAAHLSDLRQAFGELAAGGGHHGAAPAG